MKTKPNPPMGAAGGVKVLGGWPPTLGRSQSGLNWIHGPLGQNRVAQHHGLKTLLYGNDDCAKLRYHHEVRSIWKRTSEAFHEVLERPNRSSNEVLTIVTSWCCPFVRNQPTRIRSPSYPLHHSKAEQECACFHCWNIMDKSLWMNSLDDWVDGHEHE